MDKSELYIKELLRSVVNVYKLCYEEMGYDLGDTRNFPEYRNYLIDNPIDFNNKSIFDTGYDQNIFGGTPMISSGQTKSNALVVISTLVKELGLTKEQAAGVAGVMTAESQINPAIFNKDEKNGTYKSSSANNEGKPYGDEHCPWSYGAGICQWTFCNRKENAIMGGLGVDRNEAIKIIKGGGIESLTLEQQLKMLMYELKTSYRYTYEGLKKCKTASQAAATFYCHAIAGYSTSTQPASQNEIDKANARYSHVGANSQINKGMRYAEGYIA